MFELGDISSKRFFSEYWRKKPLFLKGGAKLLLDREVSIAEFRMLCDRLERRRSDALVRKNNCTFAESLDEVSAELRGIARGHEARMSCRVRFDGACASEGGLGSHYDRNDSFVLQQAGSERWRLCPSEMLSPNELRARMLKQSPGLVHMPDECHEYIVEPGDLLYVPMLWGHWAVSEGGPSLTISLVIDAVNAIDLLLPALAQVLADDRAWWMPLPQVPLEEQKLPIPNSIEQCFDVLLESLSRPDFAKRAKSAWWREGYLRGRTVKPLERPMPSSSRRLQMEDVGLDPRAAARMTEVEIRPPDPETSALPGDRVSSLLGLYVARRAMSDLFSAALASRTRFSAAQASAPVLHVAWALQHAELDAIAPLIARPEVTSWLWRMSEALEFRQVSYYEEIASAVTRLFFPALLESRAHLRGSTMPIGRSHERGINLLALKRRLVSPVPLGTRMNVSLLGPLLRFSSAAGVLVEFPLETVLERGTVDLGSGFFVEDLPATSRGSIVLLERDAWMMGQYPRGGRFGLRPLADAPVKGLLDTIDRHVQAIEQVWPELGRELSSLISVALPLAGRDSRVQTAPPFLGAIAITEHARPADLVEELGRTKARLIASAGLAFERPPRWDQRERFENAVAGAYRRAFEELAGIEISEEPTLFSEALSPWGRAFMDAVFELMK